MFATVTLNVLRIYIDIKYIFNTYLKIITIITTTTYTQSSQFTAFVKRLTSSISPFLGFIPHSASADGTRHPLLSALIRSVTRCGRKLHNNFVVSRNDVIIYYTISNFCSPSASVRRFSGSVM